MFMIKNPFIFRKFVLTIVFLLTVSWLTSCSRSPEITAIAANQSNRANKKPMNNPTLPNTNGSTETEPLDLSKVPTVTYCELIKNAADYDKKIVRVRAIYFNAFERTYLYDERCEIAQSPVAPEKVPAETWAEWDKSLVTKGDSETAVLNRQLNGFGRKDVLLIGKFNSSRAEGDANFPNLFGHLNCCRFQFQIMRLEKLFSPPTVVEEGQNTVRMGQVESLKESEGKVSVAVAPFAQMFYLHRSDPNFEEYLGLLNEAMKTKRPVWCSIRASSGRIVKVSNHP